MIGALVELGIAIVTTVMTGKKVKDEYNKKRNSPKK